MPISTDPHGYVIPAMRDWLSESFDRIHLHLDARMVDDPFLLQYVNDGQLVLNVSPGSTPDFSASADLLRFSARFNGKHHDVMVLPTAVVAMHAFNKADPNDHVYHPLPQPLEQTQTTPATPPPNPGTKEKRSHLSVVK